MSKGFGHVQLALLHLLRRRKIGVGAAALACRVFRTEAPTRAQLESVRRALRNLRRQGFVDIDHRRTVYKVR